MPYWTAAQLQPGRQALSLHLLVQENFTVYAPSCACGGPFVVAVRTTRLRGNVTAFTYCRGDEDIDTKRSRPSIGKPVFGSCEERTREFVWDRSADHIRASGQRPHSKAEYMTAPERFADSQIPLAPRAPSYVSRQSAPRLIGDATAALASLCRPQTISCRDGVHLLGGGLPGLMDSIRRCRTGG